MSKSDSVERFLATGEHDPAFPSWGGDAAAGAASLARVLRRVVRWRAKGAPLPARSGPARPIEAVNARIAPLVTGLFGDRPALTRALADRVQVVTVSRFVEGLEDLPLEVQWTLANLLLDDLGAPPLSDDAPQLDGFCAEGRAWVLPRAFDPSGGPTDVVVHEVAHLLHELTRGELAAAPADAPLLAVPANQRETWAYACEVWAWATRDQPEADVLAQRIAPSEYGRAHTDARVDAPLLHQILAAAVAAPEQGWALLRAGVGAPDPLPL